MAPIRIRNLTFGYPGSSEIVFSDLNLDFDSNWKLGLVGRNGRGKTTLMRLLAKQMPYSGSISQPADYAMFPPSVARTDLPAAAVLLELHPDAELWQLEREISLMGMDLEVLERQFSALSGGEQTKLLLSGLFLDPDALVCIDEPTNHLDAEGRRYVARYLRGKRGFIVSSHDRQFLDGCIDHVLALNRTGQEICAGNFSRWLEEFEQRQKAEREQSGRLRKEVQRLSQAARDASAWSMQAEKSKRGAADKGYVGHKAAKMMQRAKNTERRRTRAMEQKAALLKDDESADALKMFPIEHPSDPLVRATDLELGYPGRTLFAPVRFELRRGDRLSLEGENGCGKSTLLQYVAGRGEAEHAGILDLPSGIRISYVPQFSDHLAGSLRDMAAERQIDETRFLTVLRKLGFERALFERDIAALSEGQKKKVLMAASLCEQAHLYVWDEPLNYLDIYARLQIESVLRQFEPTMLFVEHDRAFRDAVATQHLVLSRSR